MDEVGLKELIGIGSEDMAQEVENFEAGSIFINGKISPLTRGFLIPWNMA